MNWEAVGVITPLVALVATGIGVYVRLSISANKDTAVPVAAVPALTAEQIKSIIAGELADAEIRQRVERLEERLAEADAKVVAKDSEIEALKAKDAERELELRRMRMTVTEQHGEIERLRSTVTSLQNRVSAQGG